MTDQLGGANELARRFVACKRWRWLPGMLTTDKSRLLSGAIGRDEDDGDVFEFSNRGNGVVGSLHEFELPDLSDAATIGCILALVREAWGDQGLHCAGRYSAGKWLWHVQGGKTHGATFRRHVYAIGHDTEAEALVAALEAAP